MQFDESGLQGGVRHERWLIGGERYAAPVLKAVGEFMETPV